MKAVFLCWRGERRTRGGASSKFLRLGPASSREANFRDRSLEIHLFWMARNLEPKSVMRHAVSVPDWVNAASVRILFLATPRRSPLRLRLGEKHAAWHKRAIFPKSDDRFGFNSFLGCPCFEENPKAKNRNGTESQEHNEIRAGADGRFAGFFCLPERSHGGLHVFLR